MSVQYTITFAQWICKAVFAFDTVVFVITCQVLDLLTQVKVCFVQKDRLQSKCTEIGAKQKISSQSIFFIFLSAYSKLLKSKIILNWM